MPETQGYEPIVRPYTEDECARIEHDLNETPRQKIRRLVARHEIDSERCMRAAIDHPSKKEHYIRLIVIGSLSIDAWIEHTGLQDEFMYVTEIPYGGTEAPGRKYVERVVDPIMATIPA